MRLLLYRWLCFLRLILSFFLLFSSGLCLFGRSKPKNLLNRLKKVFLRFWSEVKFWNVQIFSRFLISAFVECRELLCGSLCFTEQKTHIFFFDLVLCGRAVCKGWEALNLELRANFLAFSCCAVNANYMHVCVLFFGKAQPFTCHRLAVGTPWRKEF